MAAAEEAAFRPSYYGLGSLEMPDAEDINIHEDEDRDFIENLRATAQRKQPAEHDVKYWGGADQPWRNGTDDSPIIDEAIIAREEVRKGEAEEEGGCDAKQGTAGYALYVNEWETSDRQLVLEYGSSESGCSTKRISARCCAPHATTRHQRSTALDDDGACRHASHRSPPALRSATSSSAVGTTAKPPARS